MRTVSSAIGLFVSTAAFAHDSTVSHAHPHGVSMLPDYLAALVIASVFTGAVIAFHIWRKG